MSIDLFDTHCHLNLADSFPDPAPLVARANEAGVTRLALVGIDIASSRRAIELAEIYDGTYAIVGRHPNYAADYDPFELKELEQMLTHPKVIAIGEIGLDFHWDYATRDQQDRCLADQLDLANDASAPVVFHCREAYPELLTLLENRTLATYLFHCFSGTPEDAVRAQALDGYFGFDGPLTFKKADPLRRLVGSLPRDRVLLETDSPYMTPEPFRGKPNEPSFLSYVNATLSIVWECTAEESARMTTNNALRLFGIEI